MFALFDARFLSIRPLKLIIVCLLQQEGSNVLVYYFDSFCVACSVDFALPPSRLNYRRFFRSLQLFGKIFYSLAHFLLLLSLFNFSGPWRRLHANA